MSLLIEKIDKNNFIHYKDKLLKSLFEEYKKEYNIVLDDNQIEKLIVYCESYMYVLIFKSLKTKLIGYFSLSRTDLNMSHNVVKCIINYIVGNVYLFDVYILPNYRNKGIGTYLVRKAVEIAEQDYSAKSIYLYTNSDLLTKFYNSNRFDYVKNVQIDNKNLLLFHRKISN